MMNASQQLPPLLYEVVENRCQPRLCITDHLNVLRWLVWLPLLTRAELALVTGQLESTLWGHLDYLTRLELLDYVAVNEKGWPRCYHYYLTDLGVYVLATLDPHPISVSKLARSYPITRIDLLERLARPRVHLVLSELVARLIAEHPPEYRLSSYQQPFKEAYTTIDGKTHTLLFDAAFLLQTSAGMQHAFYVRVDQPEHMLSQKEVKAFVQKLLDLRQARHLSHQVMPHLLILSSKERFSFWAEQVNRATLAQGIALLDVSKPEAAREHMDLSCSIADCDELSRGAYALTWTPFHALITQDGAVLAQNQTSISSFLDREASVHLIEHLSQSFSFHKALLSRDTGPLSRSKKGLTRYVNSALRQEAVPLVISAAPQGGKPFYDRESTEELLEQLSEAFYGGPEDRLTMSTLLTLALSDQQKVIIAHLARHAYLGCADLLTLLEKKQSDSRLLMRQIMPLIHLRLVKTYTWTLAPSAFEKERFCLCEPALRFLATRHGLSPTYYLDLSYAEKQKRRNLVQPSEEEKPRRESISPLSRNVAWVQRGAQGLRGKEGELLHHTSGIYRCVRSIWQTSYNTHAYQVLYWKSASESERWYRDLLESDYSVSIRPDAELLYTTQASPSTQALLIEYDRNTTTLQQLIDKFSCYVEYQHDTRSTLPTILVITQNEQAIQKIRKAISRANAAEVSIVVALEDDILQYGLTTILDQCH